VTDARVIEATVEACLKLFPKVDSILVGDCPLQYANWRLLCEQSALTPIIDRLVKLSQGRVRFRDLRKEVFDQASGSFMVAGGGEHGDPSGYREVSLGTRSHLEPISDQARR